ncbi:MAG: hypothetical protein JSS10_07835 [Verrucomicrobia bacterium]|nr:hypothetical protein [Verrucomicrobiota bacterium]
MFPIIDKFIPESLAFLSSLKTPEEIADGCIKLLKGNGINRLSDHEFTHWLGQSKNCLETALKVDQKSKDVRDLLKAELNVRKHHVRIPVYLHYGKVLAGKVVEPPQMRLLCWERISQSIIPARGKENWNEEAAMADILDRKENFEIDLDGSPVSNPYMVVKKYFNAPAPQDYYVVQTREDADALNSYLANLKIFSWKDYIYCELRSHAACEYLEGFNVDPQQLYYVRLGKMSREESVSFKTPDGRRWGYHQAIAVKIPSGELLVLDPASDPEKALTVDEWSGMYENSKVYQWPALESPQGERPDLKQWHSGWGHGKYTAGQEHQVKTAFAVARKEHLPDLKEIISESHPHLKAITQEYELS